jgi:hypothetical protein
VRCVSVPTEAVGHRSRARQAAISSSWPAGCRAKTDLAPRRTISPGATVREAAQSIQSESIYQSPGAESAFRWVRLAMRALNDRLALFYSEAYAHARRAVYHEDKCDSANE